MYKSIGIVWALILIIIYIPMCAFHWHLKFLFRKWFGKLHVIIIIKSENQLHYCILFSDVDHWVDSQSMCIVTVRNCLK